jgi:hypothetical protein
LNWQKLSSAPGQYEPDLEAAIKSFDPPLLEREADVTERDYLIGAGWRNDPEREMWVCIRSGAITAFYSAGTAEAIIEKDGRAVPSLHIAHACRAAGVDHGDQAILTHCSGLARQRGLTIITLDPLDPATVRPWRQLGFQDSFTWAFNERSLGYFRQFQRLAGA